MNNTEYQNKTEIDTNNNKKNKKDKKTRKDKKSKNDSSNYEEIKIETTSINELTEPKKRKNSKSKTNLKNINGEDKINENKSDIEIKIKTETNDNTINNKNSEIIRGFDEKWEVSHMTNELKEQVFLCSTKFTTLLEYILENNINQNVIMIDKDKGMVYMRSKNNYVEMPKLTIIEKTLEKIYIHLKDFYNEFTSYNINSFSQKIFNHELNEMESMYITLTSKN